MAGAMVRPWLASALRKAWAVLDAGSMNALVSGRDGWAESPIMATGPVNPSSMSARNQPGAYLAPEA
jgi:hypothetical protein